MGLQDRLKSIIDEKFHGKKAEFARALDIHPTTIAKWTDEHPPTGRILGKMETLIGLNTGWLLYEKGEPWKRRGEAGLAADKSGLWGDTRRVAVEGEERTLTLFTPEEGARQTEPASPQALDMLNDVMVAGDSVLRQALMANLIAFSRAARRDKAQADRIRDLEGKCLDLMERLEAVEKRLGTPAPQPGEGAGALKK